MRQTELEAPEFLARLRRGDEAAYRILIRRLHGSLVGLATTIIGSRAQAEEVVQDAWLAVFSGIGSFEGRSTLATWVFSIVLNRARTRATREGRLVGLPALMEGAEPGGRAVDIAEFKPDGHWIEAPLLWDEISPERIVGGRQLRDHVMAAIDRLPAGQRAVIILRDMEGCDAAEACTLLGVTMENQRVLLHRARGRVRQAIDELVGSLRSARAVASASRGRRGGEATALERFAALPRAIFLRVRRARSEWPGGAMMLSWRVFGLGREAMALRKAKSTTASKSRAPAATQRRPSREQMVAATGAADLNRLLREAAWSRMFGRVESKNPFTR
ncbi:MAG TPA: sigma-70 family RNA polymerase sigma factor [Acetobacteraceae bacterium]|jgi:RNA polymerase sigma-70 factor (ECF subfamily)